jgi:hypothetical protein
MRLAGVCRYERLEIIVRRGPIDAGGAGVQQPFSSSRVRHLQLKTGSLMVPRIIPSCSCKGPLAYVTLASFSSVGLFVHGAL